MKDILASRPIHQGLRSGGTGLARAAFHCYPVFKVVIGCITFFLKVGGNGKRTHKNWCSLKMIVATEAFSRGKMLPSTKDISKHEVSQQSFSFSILLDCHCCQSFQLSCS